jgi:hypothetical protein
MSDDRKVVERRRVFFKIPMNWRDLTREEKHAWAHQFFDAAIAAAAAEDRPKLDGQDVSGVGQA